MARQVDIMATESGAHYLLLGLDADCLSSFKLQMWITKYGPRAVDWMQSLSLKFISFMGGDVYLHNDDTANRLELFGEKKECKFGVVANQEPQSIKIMDAIALYTDGEWEVESVTIPASLNYPDGMYSEIPKEAFVRREGIYKANFFRNMKTYSSTARAIEAITGEQLRGNVAYVILKNTSSDRVKIWKIDFVMNKSR